MYYNVLGNIKMRYNQLLAGLANTKLSKIWLNRIKVCHWD